jgi:signal transduction histidine kinase
MSSSQTDKSTGSGLERERVERVFAELGLLGDRGSCERASARAQATAGDTDLSGDPGGGRNPHAASLAFAGELFADAAPALASDPRLIARLFDHLGQVIGVSRAHVGRELIGRVGLAMLPPELATETLLALVEGGERRVMRLGLDLHDGPLQELLLMAEDLRLFREQLVGVLGDRDEFVTVAGRLDDLEARLLALEGGLRRISRAVDAGGPPAQPFSQGLEEIVRAFAERCEITPNVTLEGDPEAISASQRIALLSVVGEALNNVREHARAVSGVGVEIAIGADGVRARVVDDGRGFDVEQALVRAARHGRMGLAGIHERVRLLGGSCVIESRSGGPTSISLRLPRWESPASTAQPADAAAATSRRLPDAARRG